MDYIVIILSFLYAGTGVVATIGYIPTILDLIKKIPSANISSYLIWTSCAFITFLYAFLVISDLLLEIVTGLNFLSCFIVLLLSLNLKYSHKNS